MSGFATAQPQTAPARLADKEKRRTIESWMTQHGTRIMRLAYTYMKDRHAAEDIAQEVFFRAYQHLDSFRGDCQAVTWLSRIAINLCRDRLRASASRPEVMPAEMPVIAGELGEPEAEMMRRGEREILAHELMALPEVYREVLVLHYYGDHSIEEIAFMTGRPEGTVKTHLHRGRNLLRERIASQMRMLGSPTREGARP